MRCLAPGILRPVDETHQIAVVKVTEALHFVYRRNSISETRHDLRRNLEAQIHALGADVEKQIAWRGDRVARSCANLPERVEFGGPRRSKEAVPRVGPKAHDAGEAGFQVPKIHRAQQRGEVSAERPQGCSMVRPGFTVTTRKIAARVSGAATGCATARTASLTLRASSSGRASSGCHPSKAQDRAVRAKGCRQAYHPLTKSVHWARLQFLTILLFAKSSFSRRNARNSLGLTRSRDRTT